MTWTTSKQAMDALRYALLPTTGWPKGLWATEVEAPRSRKLVRRRGRTVVKKSGPRRRADAIWVPANENRIIGFEIKVTRMDLERELAVPAKTEAWKQYCNAWFLVVGDPLMLAGLTIPEDWGVLAPPTGRATRTLTTVVPATELTPTDQTPAWCRLIGWQAWQHYQLQLRTPVQNRPTDDELWEWEDAA